VSAAISEHEPLTRFIFNRNCFGAGSWHAFEPHPDDRKTSVFRVVDLSEEAVWTLHTHIATNRALKGRADLFAAAAYKNGLDVEASEPPAKHADIIGWPLERDKVMLIAKELAAEAQFLRVPTPDVPPTTPLG
jgi:hypothetical protein